MKKRFAIAVLSSTLIAALFAGCSKDEGKPIQAASEPAKPVKLSVYQYSAFLTDEEFQTFMVEPVKKKYPHITLELVRSGKGTTPEELVAAGTVPDLIYTGGAGAVKMIELNAVKEMTGLLGTKQIDLNKFEPVAIEAIKQYSPTGQLTALPLALNFSVMYYNKDIFDMMGAPYPKDGMNWDDTIELAKKVTRESGGIQYKGWDVDGGVQRFGEQLVLPVVDPKTLKATINTDGWKKAIDTLFRIKSIPGNDGIPSPINAFEQERNLAMFSALSARLGELEQMHNEGRPMNWDMASMPTFPEKPKNAFGANQFLLMVSSSTKHENEVMQLIKLFTDEEVQLALNKRGRLTSLKDKKFQNTFGENLNSMKGKNKEAIFKTTAAPLPPITVYDPIARSQAGIAAGEVLSGKSDLNTALRNAEEKANQLIEAEKGKK